MSSASTTGLRIAVRGTVQGVGLRPWVYQLAHQLDLRGTVKNGPEGVTIDAFGARDVLDRLIHRLETEAPPAARIERVGWSPLVAPPPDGFTIVASDHHGVARASLPADLAMCDACRAEVHDPKARRFHYPFTNCTHCGPRFSIATSIPYDRPNTTLAHFALCPDCRAEYEDPLDRRFHAQPIACPACGPKLAWRDATGAPLDVPDVLERAAHRLLEGDLVALRGLGGFHLACDATNEAAVRELEVRKHRDEKPFAVMVPDLETALRHAALGPAEVALLTAPSRPIVLARSRSGLAPSVAPGLAELGLFLPYTPLHELLLHRVRRPLVMTSGNRSNEPMAVETDDALLRLRGIADGFVVHDRPIATRTDDSVARVVAGAPMVLRRARGWVPDALPSPVPFTEPVLAAGGQLKNTFCIGKGDRLTLGPHVGDLDDAATFQDFERMVTRLERFLEVSPHVIAHDRHPDYETTRYALQRPARAHVAVQHHHAHVAAVMAEHGLTGSVLGVAFDGTGWGDDGAAWGGEVLRASYTGFERLATLRPIALAGGEQASRQPGRLALAVLDDAFDGAPPLGR
ncbi:MAG: carbamoyltransferase HypF, partial [Myxococcaceae bacterium]|nr:carbamoyltransferase HypF [Myxococcaceae bacterium]